MEELFGNYDELYQKFRELQKGKLSRRLRVFDIRFRLALDSVTDYVTSKK